MPTDEITIEVQKKIAYGQWETISTLTRFSDLSWSYIQDGYYAETSLTIEEEFVVDSKFLLEGNFIRRVLIRLGGIIVYAGVIRKPGKVFDLLQTKTVTILGLADEMNNKIVRKTYAPPGGQDLSWYFLQLAYDFIIPYGYAQRIDIEQLGSIKSTVICDGTLREVITDLTNVSDGFIYWGLKMDPATEEVIFFVRKREPDDAATYNITAGEVVYDPATGEYEPAVKLLTHYKEDAELANALYIDGGDFKYPNLLKNPSFEEVRNDGTGTSNLLINGDFDGGSVGWDLFNDVAAGDTDLPSIKSEPDDMLLGGTNNLELDRVGEGVNQRVETVAGGQHYALTFSYWLEDQNFPAEANVVITFYDDSDTILGLENKGVTDATRQPQTKTLQALAPAGTSYAIVTVMATMTNGSETYSDHANERGILFKNIIMSRSDETYQYGWRVETSLDPSGQNYNSDPLGVYSVRWDYNYEQQGVTSPGMNYGSYGVFLAAFNSLNTNRAVRLISSQDGEIEVSGNQWYNLSVYAKRLSNGSDPNLRLGYVWYDKEGVTNFVNLQDFTITESWARYGKGFNTPIDAVKIRVFLEVLEDSIVYFDGVVLNQSPIIPDDFYADGDKAKFYVTVRDVFTDIDPEYDSILPPPDGYGLQEAIVSNELITTKAEAYRYAKLIFKIRALPQSSIPFSVLQSDSPYTLYKPDGYYQIDGFEGLTLPKLWASVINYAWTDGGLLAEIELEKETPKLDQLLERDRKLTVTTVGTGGDDASTYVAPREEVFTVLPDDPRLEGDTIIRLDTDEDFNYLTVEAALRTLELPQNQTGWDIETSVETYLVIILTDGSTIEPGDEIIVWYVPSGGKYFPFRTKKFEAAGTSPELCVIFPPPLPGSVRGFLRGRRISPSDYDVVIGDSRTADTIELNTESLGIEAGDELFFLYHPTDEVVRYPFNRTILLTAETEYDIIGIVPYQWDENDYSVVGEINGLLVSEIEFTVTTTGMTVTIPESREGDTLVVRGHIA